jgi:hypothetical protein
VFLDANRVTREDVYAQLGAPHATFEGEHVITYRLGQSKEDYFVVRQEKHKEDVNWEGVSDDLVLAFDDEGVLRQHSLVPIRAPAGKR